VAAFLLDAPPLQYGVNRAIDAQLSQLNWDDLRALMQSAGLLRIPRHLSLLRDLVKQAQALWPALLRDAPPRMQAVINTRLQGGVNLSS
jgi:serine/threonine-protein kinase HipA